MNPEEYQSPRIEDYGTVEELTNDPSLLSPLGLGSTVAAVTSPIHTPGGPGGNVVGHGNAGPATTPGGGGDVGVQGVENTGSNGGDTGDQGAGAGSPGGGGGSGGGGGGGSGGNAAELPFTGFPAVLAAAVGGALTATGAALRRALRPRRD